MRFLALLLLLTSIGSAQEPWDPLEVYPTRSSRYSLKGRWWTPTLPEPKQGTVWISGENIEALSSLSDEGVETEGLIIPGLIDLHDHIAYAYAPRFAGYLWPENQKFANRYQWQGLTRMFHEKHSRVARPAGALFYLFGEVRELVGGTTSVANHVKGSAYGVLARSLDGDTRTHGLPISISSLVFFFDRDLMLADPPVFQVDPETVKRIESSDLCLVHLAEGRRDDALTRQEFESFLKWARTRPDLAPKIVPIHVVGIEGDDFGRLRELGIDRAVWSPSSNKALYDQTMDVGSALRHGFTIALGTDWYPSGSDSLFDELRLAKHLVSEGLVVGLDPDELPPMVLEAPAKILGGRLGTLLPGAPADLVVIPWEGSLAASLESADVDTILLVTVAGKPLFGVTQIMESLLGTVYRSPVRSDTHAYGFDISQIWDEVKSRFPDAVPPEPLEETVYPRLQHP